jgi:hypothetical protein
VIPGVDALFRHLKPEFCRSARLNLFTRGVETRKRAVQIEKHRPNFGHPENAAAEII